MNTFVTAVKQYPGQVQVTRSVKVKVPGKHFPQLQPNEQAQDYWGEAVEYKERHNFPRHAKAWGAGRRDRRSWYSIYLHIRRRRRSRHQGLLDNAAALEPVAA